MLRVKKRDKGFTLVEIIVVLLIIGILLAITIPSIMGYVRKAEDAKLIADMRTLVLEANETATKYFVNDRVDVNDLSYKIIKKYKNEEYGDGFKIYGYLGSESTTSFSIYYDDYNGEASSGDKTKPQINKVNPDYKNHYISKICIVFNKGSTYKYVIYLKNKEIRVFNSYSDELLNPNSEWYFPIDAGA